MLIDRRLFGENVGLVRALNDTDLLDCTSASIAMLLISEAFFELAHLLPGLTIMDQIRPHLEVASQGYHEVVQTALLSRRFT